ncbi:MAG: hypothetical protein ACRDD7_14290 [Peptostreptococcaceae bacterium]
MIVDKIIDFIETCPYLDELAHVQSEYLEENAVNYCLEVSPATTIIQSYIDGSTERQLLFTFSSKEVMSDFDDLNIQNMNFYEHFTEWIEEQNSLGNLPKLDGKMSSISVEILSPGYVTQSEADRGRYCIEMRLIYYKKK